MGAGERPWAGRVGGASPAAVALIAAAALAGCGSSHSSQRDDHRDLPPAAAADDEHGSDAHRPGVAARWRGAAHSGRRHHAVGHGRARARPTRRLPRGAPPPHPRRRRDRGDPQRRPRGLRQLVHRGLLDRPILRRRDARCSRPPASARPRCATGTTRSRRARSAAAASLSRSAPRAKVAERAVLTARARRRPRHLDRRPLSAGAGLYSGALAAVAQLARASACHAEGRGFESLQPLSRKPR